MADIHNKVFCTQCGYFNACRRNNCGGNMQFDDEDVHEQCNAPQNIRPTYMSDGSDKYISSPSIINKYNNCKWFVAKGQPTDVHILINKHNNDKNAHQKIQSDVAAVNQRVTELDQRSQYNINNHIQNLDNPHNVTKAQLGIANVDNTADLDKPISRSVSAALAAIDQKIEENIGAGSTAITTLRNSLNAEISRAQQVESAINSELTNERQRAGLAEAAISGNVSTVATNLTNETGRAQATESALQSAINTLNNTVSDTNQHLTNTDNTLTQEVIRAKQEEAELRSDLTRLSDSIDGKDAAVLSAAQRYADAQDTIVLASASSDATTKKNEAIDAARIDAAAKASDAVRQATDYTDDRESALRSEIIDAENDVRAYVNGEFRNTIAGLINQKGTIVETECKRYTDETISDTSDAIRDLQNGKADKATTLNGYGITDSYTKDEVDDIVDDINSNIDTKATKTELATLDAKVDTKADSNNVYDKTYINEQVTAKIDKLNGTESVDGSVINTVKTEISKLDVPASAIVDEYVTDVIEVDGKISVTRSHITNNQVGTLSNDLTAVRNRLNVIEGEDNIPGSINKALKDAKSYTDSLITTTEGEITVSLTAINNEINTIKGNDETEGSFAKAVKDASDALSGDISNHILSQNAHEINQITGLSDTLSDITSDINDINQTLETKAEKATTVAGYGITDAYTKDEVYTKDETDNNISTAVDAVDSKFPGYLPLTGNKTVTKNVKFNEGITVKTEANGDNTLNINGDKISRTDVTDTTYNYELPNKSGVVAVVSDVNAAKAEVTAVTDDLTSRVETLEASAIPSEITSTVKGTSLSTDKDVPSNYAVSTALSTKANKQETQDALDLKANAAEVYDKDTADGLLNAKANLSYVNTKLAEKADLNYVDTELVKKANANVTYTKSEVDAKLATKAENGNVYSTEVMDNLLLGKADVTDLQAKADANSVYTKDETDDLLDVKANASDVTSALATKANTDDVTSALANKVDTSTLTSTVAAINDSIDLKANAAEVYTKNQVYTKAETDAKIGTVYRPQGSVESYANLPSSGMEPGFVYNVLDTGANYVWTENEGWDKLSETVDISGKQDSATAVTHQELTAVGNAGVPVYIQSDGSATACSVDSTAGGSINSASLINSGAVYAGLVTKANAADVYAKTETYNKTEINSKISDINDDIANVYTKAQVDAKVDGKVDNGYCYSKQETDNLLSTKAVKTEVYTKEATNDLLDTKANAADVYDKTAADALLATKADKATTYTKSEIDSTVSGLATASALVSGLADKADKVNTYTKTEVNTALDLKADKTTTYTKTEVDNAVNVKANSADVYLKSEVTNMITGVTRDYEAADTETLNSAKTYTDNKIRQIKDRHYIMETITPGDNGAYYVKDFYSNNINLTGVTGTVLIYLPTVVTETTGGAREFLINITGWDFENSNNHIGLRTTDGNVTFRCKDMVDENNFLIIEKNDFSLKFQEYDNFKFLIDECGLADTTNNNKIEIDMNQVTLRNGLVEYKLIVDNDGQLHLLNLNELNG